MEKILRFAQNDKGKVPKITRTVELNDLLLVASETRDPKPETFFDAEFLKKLERLRLIAKRLSWANAKGEHPSSRRGFSLSSPTTGDTNRAMTSATSTGIFTAGSIGCC